MQPYSQIRQVAQAVCPQLTEQEWADFEAILQCRELKAGDYFGEPGQLIRTVGFINRGLIRIFYRDAKGKEIPVFFGFENQFFSDLENMLTNQPSRFYMEAMEATQLVVFNYDRYLGILDNSKNWERFGRLMMEGALREILHHVHGFLFFTPEERYLRFVRDEKHILDRIPLYQIAAYLGVERESLSRIRKRIAASPQSKVT